MPKVDRLAKDLVKAALEFHRRRPWKRTPPDAPFLLRVPEEEHPLVAVIIGQDAAEFGVIFLRGEDGFARIHELCSSGSAGEQDRASLLSLSFEEFGSIPAAFRQPLEAAGFQARREVIAPHFLVKRAHGVARSPSRGAMRLMLWAIRGILAAEEKGQLRPWTLDEARRKILEITLTGRPSAPDVRGRAVAWPSVPSGSRATPLVQPVSLPGELALLPRLDEVWIAAAPALPGEVQGEEGAPRGFIVCVRGKPGFRGACVFLGAELDVAAELLAKVMRGEAEDPEPGLPRAIAFDAEWIQAAFAQALSLLGVESVLEEESEELAALYLAMADVDDDLARRKADNPVDLPDWKEADLRFNERIAKAMGDGSLGSERAQKRYFGSVELAREVLDELQGLSPIQAFGTWLAAEYRATSKSRTFLEKLLDSKKLSAGERGIAQSHATAELSIYRVDETVPGATLTVENILTGERRVLHDRSMSGADLEGWYIPLRLCRIGEWIFPNVAGPPFGHMQILEALDLLEKLGVELTPEGLRKKAHFLGRLWGLFLARQRHPPRLRNTDDDPLEPHTATFHVSDPEAVVRALEARPDVHRDEEPGSWTWFREGFVAPEIGSTTILGRIDLFGDRLVLEVNSARRLARAREWMEALPGTRFERATRKDLHEQSEAPDDQLRDVIPPPPPDKDLQEFVEQQMRRISFAWLDQQVPALGGRTPREAFRDPAMRETVIRMIRTMPPMGMPGGRVEAPREELLAELGRASDAR